MRFLIGVCLISTSLFSRESYYTDWNPEKGFYYEDRFGRDTEERTQTKVEEKELNTFLINFLFPKEELDISNINHYVEKGLQHRYLSLSRLATIVPFERGIEGAQENNLQMFLRANILLTKRANDFADLGSLEILNNPLLGPFGKSGGSHYGERLDYHVKEAKKQKIFDSLKKEWGFLFFYKAGSAEDLTIAREVGLHIFEATKDPSASLFQFGWRPVSLDGFVINTAIFSKSWTEREALFEKMFHLPKQDGKTIAPLIFLFNPRTRTSVPIGFGTTSITTIEDNILAQYRAGAFKPKMEVQK